MSPDIYVGIPVHRGVEFVRQTLESIQNQTYHAFRCVMSVDGPDDPTIDVCRSFASDRRFEVHVQPHRLGWPGNFNWLARDCTLDYFCYWQQDDIATTDYLGALRDTMQASPEITIAYADVRWIGDRTDLDKAVDVDGTSLQRCLQAAEALHYVPLRGLVRANRLPQRSDPIPTVATTGHQQEFVYLADLAASGPFRRSEGPLYFKRAHGANAHREWLSEPDDSRRDEWCTLGNGLIDAARRADPEADTLRLVGVVLDRLTIARAGRGFWYLPQQTEKGVSAFVREFFGRFPDQLRIAVSTGLEQPTGFERPIHYWVQKAIRAAQRHSVTLYSLVDSQGAAVDLQIGTDRPGLLMLGRGWSFPEFWGVWTDSCTAEITLPPHRFTRATLRGHTFAPHRPTRIGVSVGDGKADYHFSETETTLSVTLPLDQRGTRERLIRLHTPDAISPIDAGVSADQRQLGFELSGITLDC